MVAGRGFWIVVWYGIMLLGLLGFGASIYWGRETNWKNLDELLRAIGTILVSSGMLLLLYGVATSFGQVLLVLALFCFVGAFAQRNSLPDLYVMAAFGLIGFLFERFKFPLAPLVLGTILGPIAESNFMTTMVSFDNDWTVFFTRPISGAILALSALGLAWPVLRSVIAHMRKVEPSGSIPRT